MRGAAGAALVMMVTMPETLHFCPVFFDRDDEASIAFLATPGLLTLLPLGLVVGTGATRNPAAPRAGRACRTTLEECCTPRAGRPPRGYLA